MQPFGNFQLCVALSLSVHCSMTRAFILLCSTRLGQDHQCPCAGAPNAPCHGQDESQAGVNQEGVGFLICGVQITCQAAALAELQARHAGTQRCRCQTAGLERAGSGRQGWRAGLAGQAGMEGREREEVGSEGGGGARDGGM